jgi:hypothetical protein
MKKIIDPTAVAINVAIFFASAVAVAWWLLCISVPVIMVVLAAHFAWKYW